MILRFFSNPVFIIFRYRFSNLCSAFKNGTKGKPETYPY